MRILITEEALRLGNGHWPSYVQDLAEGFRAAGDQVDILAHKEAHPKVFEAVPGAIPWFSRDCRADPRSQGLLGGIRHNFSFARDLKAWLNEKGPYDWVLSLSSRPKHLMGFALLTKRNAPFEIARTRFVVMFVLGFGKFAGAGEPAFIPNSPVTYFTKFCFWMVADAVRRGQVVLAAETKGMQAEVERFSGLPTVLFPHPVEAAQTPEIEGTTKNTNIHERGEEVSTTIERQGGRENEQPKVGPKGEGVASCSESYTARRGTTESNGSDIHGYQKTEQGDAQVTCAGASEPDSLTSKLADSPVSESRTRSASGPASLPATSYSLPPACGVRRLLHQAATAPQAPTPATSYSLLATAPQALALDAPAKSVVVTAPGYARYEKGSDLLQGAIKILLKRMRDDKEVPRLRFVLQWQEEFVTPEGKKVSPDPELKASPYVEFLDGIRVGEAYLDVLRGADLIVLPYRSRAYNRRVSRISVEAALMGKPIVYMRHTWSREVAELAGCGAEIPEESPEAIAEALLQAARNLPWLAEKARTGRIKVGEFYSVETFRKILLEKEMDSSR